MRPAHCGDSVEEGAPDPSPLARDVDREQLDLVSADDPCGDPHERAPAVLCDDRLREPRIDQLAPACDNGRVVRLEEGVDGGPVGRRRRADRWSHGAYALTVTAESRLRRRA